MLKPFQNLVLVIASTGSIGYSSSALAEGVSQRIQCMQDSFSADYTVCRNRDIDIFVPSKGDISLARSAFLYSIIRDIGGNIGEKIQSVVIFLHQKIGKVSRVVIKVDTEGKEKEKSSSYYYRLEYEEGFINPKITPLDTDSFDKIKEFKRIM